MKRTEEGAAASDCGVLDPRDRLPETRAALRAWLRLQATLCLRPQLACECLDASRGDPEAALRSSGLAPDREPAGLADWPALLSRHGFRAVPITASAYPDRLRALRDPAPLLLVQGDVRLLARQAVAIVGSRAATSYGRGMARSLAAGLARAGVGVVSGLARGVDAAAHRGALEAPGATVAVQACGPDRIYPPEHAALRREIARSGAVVTELPPGYPPRAAFFPLRNRLISGLVPLVVVVEARERSGSLVTVRHALDQGRDVMALPGPVTSPTSAGPNRLLREGARPVLELRDMLECLGLPDPALAAAEAAPSLPGPEQQRGRELLARLRSEPMSRDALARALSCRPQQLAAALLELELDGWIEQDRDGCLRCRPDRAGTAGDSVTAAGPKHG